MLHSKDLFKDSCLLTTVSRLHGQNYSYYFYIHLKNQATYKAHMQA